MTINNFLQKTETKQTLLAVVIFFLLSLFYFSPLLNKYVLQQSDTILVQGMTKNIDDFRKSHQGKEPYWSTTMFSGMPSYTISANYDGNIIQYLKIALDLGLPHPIGILFLGMTLSYILGLSLGVSPWVSVGGGIAYGLTTYHILIMEAGHYQKIYALMYAPGVLAGIVQLYQKKWILGAILLFITLGLEVYAAHVQMTYYLLFTVGCFVVYQFIHSILNKELKNFVIASAISASIGVLSLIINANNLYPLYQYSKFSIRGPSELQSTKEELKGGGLDKDYAYAWSQGRVELSTFFIPNAVGGASGTTLDKKSASYKVLSGLTPNAAEILKRWPTYWGDQSFTSGPYYSGIIILALAILSLYLVPSAIKFPFLFAALLSFLLALGKNSFSVVEGFMILSLPIIAYFKPKSVGISDAAYGTAVSVGGFLAILMIAGSSTDSYRFKDLFFDYLPMYNKFRVPSSMLVIAQLCLPVLAILGLMEFLKSETEAEKKKTALIYSFGLTAGVLAIMGFMPSLFFDFTCPQDEDFRNQLMGMTQGNKGIVDSLMNALSEDRASMLFSDALRGLVFVGIMGAILWFYLKGSIQNAMVVSLGFVALSTIDLYTLSRRYLNKESYTKKIEYQQNFQPREADAVLSQQDKSYYRVFPLDRNPFNDGRTVYHLNSIGGYNAAKIKRYQQLIEKHLAATLNPFVINMLNIKYLITSKPLNSPQYRQVLMTNDKEVIYENVMNCGPAWFVNEVIVVNTPDETLDTLSGLDTRFKAVIESKDKQNLGTISNTELDSIETITVQKVENNYLLYQSKSKETRFAVFSEVYYNRGWKAFIDGKEVPILHTNFVLRGLVVPQGEHKIEFKFEPDDVTVGETMSYIGSVILLLLIGVGGFLGFRGTKNAEK